MNAADGRGWILACRGLPSDPAGLRDPPWAGAVSERLPPAGVALADRGPPIVGEVDLDLFRVGESVTVDGTAGTVELPDVEEIRVVTSFLQRADGRILLLRRSDRVGSFRGHWAAVSGFLEEARPLDQALREILEETGIAAGRLRLAAEGRRVYARDDRRVYAVHPFRFEVAAPEVRLDWEHTAHEWVDPSEILRRPVVPKLDRVWATVAPPSDPSAPRAVEKR